MTPFQKLIKYGAVAFAFCLIAGIIGGAVATLGGITWFFGKDSEETSGEIRTYTVNQDIREIDIEVAAADCEFITGDIFSVESNSAKISVKDSAGKLTVRDSTKNIRKEAIKVIVTIPEKTDLEKIEISADVGDIKAEKLVSSALFLECAAGDVDIMQATATFKAEIEGGVGDISISSGTFNNLELDMGVGNLVLSSDLTGNSELDLGVGETKLTLLGGKEKYTVSLDKGIGKATADGISLGDSAKFGNGINKVEIDSGIGDVEILFATAG